MNDPNKGLLLFFIKKKSQIKDYGMNPTALHWCVYIMFRIENIVTYKLNLFVPAEAKLTQVLNLLAGSSSSNSCSELYIKVIASNYT